VKKANPAVVGAFVLGAIALVVAVVVAVGTGTFFADTRSYVLFFDGSVNGLTVGSPVKLRGVEVGRVTGVSAIADTKDWKILNEVVIMIDQRKFKRQGPEMSDSPEKRAETLIHAGLRARLELQSFVTGQLFVGLDFHADTPAELVGGDLPYPELPTIPSTTQEVENTVRSLVARIQKLPLEELVDHLDQTIVAVRDLVQSPGLQSAVGDLDSTVDEVRSMAQDARRAVASARSLIERVEGRVDPVSDSAVAALDQARSALGRVEEAIEPGSDVRYRLSIALEQLSEAAQAIRLLADFLERNPSSVVFGRESGETR